MLSELVTKPFRRKGKSQPERFQALQDINFDIQAGERVGIIGRNGAGKSTLLKILSQITAPTTGQLVLRGRVASLLEVGTGFHPELTGRENISLNGAILGMKQSEIKRKFDEIVAFAEIEKFLDTPVKRYSSGMYVRLAFSVSAHLESEILLIDEVLAVGDLEFQKKCLDKMSEVSKTGRTILFVSHNMGAIANLCSRAILLQSGKIECVGDGKDVVTHYIESLESVGHEQHWDSPASAPGNDRVRLKSIRIVTNGKSTTNVLINQEVSIEMEYWNLRAGALLDTSIHLKDNLNAFVLASASFPSANLVSDAWSGKNRPVGIYKSVCTIPANYLNNIRYSVDVGISNNKKQFEIFMEDALAFTVHETGEMTKEYSGDWVGVVKPRLAWQTTTI